MTVAATDVFTLNPGGSDEEQATVQNVITLAQNAVQTSVTLTQVAETYTAPTISAGTLTINLANGTVFNVANNANITTFSITGTVASKANAFTLVLTANGSGFTQAWGASVVWPSGAAPTLTTTNNKRDIIVFMTNDGGTTWFGSVVGQNY